MRKKKPRICKKCGDPITKGSKSGLCIKCSRKRTSHPSRITEKIREGLKKAWVLRSLNRLSKDSIPVVIYYANGHVEVTGIKTMYRTKHPEEKILNVDLYEPAQREAILDHPTDTIMEFVKDKPVEEIEIDEEVAAPKIDGDWL